MPDHPPISPPPPPYRPDEDDSAIIKRLEKQARAIHDLLLVTESVRDDVRVLAEIVRKKIDNSEAIQRAGMPSTHYTPVQGMPAVQTEEASKVAMLQQRLEDDEAREAEQRLAAVEKERDELKEARRHWVRYVVSSVVTLAVGALLFMLGRLVR